MRLDFWLTSTTYRGEPVVDEAKAFMGRLKRVFLVESQAEHDLAFALQYMYGAEVDIFTVPNCSMGEVLQYLRSYDMVYTSWDPLDRNRI